jgi:PncC family amidohydrolase
LIEHNIQDFFINKKLTLSLAESCTEGALSARLVQLPNCSRYFLGSVIAYSGVTKIKLLGVKPQTLTSFGEVCAETAEEMAEGTLEQFHSDYAVAITGIAGPSGGSAEKPVNTVFIAIAVKKGYTLSWREHLMGDRPEIIFQSGQQALAHLWKW